MIHSISRGCDLPITGKPQQRIDDSPLVTRVAILGDDYVGMKPTMQVAVGDQVSAGQVLFQCKKTVGVAYASPVSGKVVEVNRGEKRKFLSVVVEKGEGESKKFPTYDDLTKIPRNLIIDNLVQSGLWTGLRTRPFNKVADPSTVPSSVFVTAIDTNPLAVDPSVVISKYEAEFSHGLAVLEAMGDYKVFVCSAAGYNPPQPSGSSSKNAQFQGPHPAGLPGTHIHYLDPVGPNKTVWHIGYQDVIAIGKLFRDGTIWENRVISVAGPRVNNPGLIEVPLGSNLQEITKGRIEGDNNRVISGSVLNGENGTGVVGYLGRYHTQVTILEEGTEREFLGWQLPGGDKFSVTKVYTGSWFGGKKFPFTTSSGGSHRAMVPIGSYEKVMPLDILPTQLLRALLCKNTDQAQALGALELAEEDLALCTFVCPGKNDYGSILREALDTIEKEG